MAKGKGGFLGQDGLNAPDEPTGVSASAGSTQATVSFTAPSDTGASAITGYRVQSDNGDGYTDNLFNLSVASYDNVSFSVNSQDLVPMDVRFKSDGTKMYVLGRGNDRVYQYSLSTAFDISTASYDSVFFYVGSQDANPQAFEFKPDGSKFYMVGNSNDTVYQYSLSTAWDMSTASYDSVSFSVSSQDTAPYGVTFNDDGTKMYILGLINDSVFQYSLSTAYDLSTASYDSVSFSFTSQDTAPVGFVFNNDGTKAFMSGNTAKSVYQYTLSTAYDISTLSYDSVSFSVSSQLTIPQGITFNNDGSKMYILGSTSDTVYQYTSGAGAVYPTESPITVYGLTNGTSYTFNVWAINASGWSAPSGASGSVTPIAPVYGVWFGGYNGSRVNDIRRVNIDVLSDATDFGDLSAAANGTAAASSTTRAVCGLGSTSSGPQNNLEYIEYATTGNATDFGDLVGERQYFAGAGNTTRGIFAGGDNNSGATNTIQYITFASAGNAADFGDLASTCSDSKASSSPTRTVISLGVSGGSASNVINFITTASSGNASDFGDLTVARWGAASASSSTRALFMGGGSYTNTIDYVTIASAGNATDFGDVSVGVSQAGACSNNTRALVNGARSSPNTVLYYVTIASTGNTATFGSLGLSVNRTSATSQGHGGLQ